MKKCPVCGSDIEDRAQFCLYCMTSLTEKEQILVHKKKKPQGLWVLVAIVAATMILLLLIIGKWAAPDAQAPSESQTLNTTATSATVETTAAPTTQATTVPAVEATEETTEPTQATTQPTGKPSGKPERPSEPEVKPTEPPTELTTQPTEQETVPTEPTTQPTEPTTQPTEPETVPTEPETVPTEPETQPSVPTHSHTFSLMQAQSKYLASAADCLNPASYYYSCACGEKGTETFPYGEANGHTVRNMPNRTANCVNPSSTGGTYCTVCQATITPPTIISPATGHKYACSSGAPTCQKCRKQGTLIILPPSSSVSADGHYQLNGCSSYTYREGTNYVTLTISITNLHPSEQVFTLTTSLVSTSGSTLGSNSDNVVMFSPGETGYCWADVYIPSADGTYYIEP